MGEPSVAAGHCSRLFLPQGPLCPASHVGWFVCREVERRELMREFLQDLGTSEDTETQRQALQGIFNLIHAGVHDHCTGPLGSGLKLSIAAITVPSLVMSTDKCQLPPNCRWNPPNANKPTGQREVCAPHRHREAAGYL